MHKIGSIFILMMCLMASSAVAQVSIGTGPHTLEIGGMASMFYNHRVLKPGLDDAKKNRFSLRDAQLQLEGRYRNLISYELQFDLADMAFNQNDPENPGLMEASVTYKGLKYLHITAGYGKTPYSQSSLMPFRHTAYWQAAEFLRGDVFARRDVGANIGASFLRQLIELQFGVYTGMGELTLRGENDASGRPEYVGRAQVAWPTRYRKSEIDERNTHLPMFMVGLNARYYDKTQPVGATLPAGSIGAYGLKVVDGTRLMLGVDGAFQWHGASVQAEWHYGEARLRNSANALLQELPDSVTNKTVRFGSLTVQANYHIRLIHLTASVRYEHFNLNDLVAGHSERIGAALQYTVPKVALSLRLQYLHILQEETITENLNWTDQLRVGLVYQFE